MTIPPATLSYDNLVRYVNKHSHVLKLLVSASVGLCHEPIFRVITRNSIMIDQLKLPQNRFKMPGVLYREE